MKELLERLRRNAEYAGGASDREASREAAALIEDLCKKIAAQDKLGEQVCVFHQWLDSATEQLDAGIGKAETASEGSLALTAASVKLAEIIAGPDESDDPTAEQYLARAARHRQRAIDEKTKPLDVEIERLRNERDAIVKELDETREKHLREARAADEARDDFETLRAQLAALRPAAEALAALEEWLRLPRPPRREVNLGFNSTGQCSCELTEGGEYASVSDGHNSIAAAITAALAKARAGA